MYTNWARCSTLLHRTVAVVSPICTGNFGASFPQRELQHKKYTSEPFRHFCHALTLCVFGNSELEWAPRLTAVGSRDWLSRSCLGVLPLPLSDSSISYQFAISGIKACFRRSYRRLNESIFDSFNLQTTDLNRASWQLNRFVIYCPSSDTLLRYYRLLYDSSHRRQRATRRCQQIGIFLPRLIHKYLWQGI